MNEPPVIPDKRDSFRLLISSPEARPAAPRARSAGDSHVRLRALSVPPPGGGGDELPSARETLDELGREAGSLAERLGRLEASIAAAARGAARGAARSRAASVRAAVGRLEAHGVALRRLADALARARVAASEPAFGRLVAIGSPLADYLRGLYAWSHALVSALEDFASTVDARPGWAALAWHIEEASLLYFDELHAPIRADVLAFAILASDGSRAGGAGPIEPLHAAVEHLIATAIALDGQLGAKLD